MKKAVMYGAGKIGRGFVGRIFAGSGCELVFLDNVQALVDELNRREAYTVRSVTNMDSTDVTVSPLRAVNSTTDQAVDEIASCDILATAVGANNLRDIAAVIARGMIARMESGGRPLDILLCENQLNAGALMRGFIYEHLDGAQRDWAEENLGLVETVIGLAIPEPTPELRAQDPLLLCAEPYSELPVDRAAFKGEIPELKGLVPHTPFAFYPMRKLFIHNGGHAACAYMGYLKGYEYLWQAAADPEIYEAVKAVMTASAQALTHRFGNEVRENVFNNVIDLLFRFQNRALKDTVARIGADPARKLRRNDRIVGAALLCMEQGVDPTPIVRSIAAALKFDREDDPTAPKIQRDLRERGIGYVIETYMGLNPGEPLFDRIKAACAQ